MARGETVKLAPRQINALAERVAAHDGAHIGSIVDASLVGELTVLRAALGVPVGKRAAILLKRYVDPTGVLGSGDVEEVEEEAEEA